MTSYEYDNLPDNFEMIGPMPDDLFPEIMRMFKAAQNNGIEVAREAKIAYVYDRKGYLTMDEFGGHRNTAYGSSDDDVVIQLTLRIQQTKSYPFAPLIVVENILKERNDEAKRLQLEGEIAALKADQEATAKALEEKLKKLSKLDVQ